MLFCIILESKCVQNYGVAIGIMLLISFQLLRIRLISAGIKNRYYLYDSIAVIDSNTMEP